RPPHALAVPEPAVESASSAAAGSRSSARHSPPTRRPWSAKRVAARERAARRSGRPAALNGSGELVAVVPTAVVVVALVVVALIVVVLGRHLAVGERQVEGDRLADDARRQRQAGGERNGQHLAVDRQRHGAGA